MAIPWRVSQTRDGADVWPTNASGTTGVMNVGTVHAQSLFTAASPLSPGRAHDSLASSVPCQARGLGQVFRTASARKASASSQLSSSRHPLPRILSFAPSAAFCSTLGVEHPGPSFCVCACVRACPSASRLDRPSKHPNRSSAPSRVPEARARCTATSTGCNACNVAHSLHNTPPYHRKSPSCQTLATDNPESSPRSSFASHPMLRMSLPPVRLFMNTGLLGYILHNLVLTR